MAYINANFMKVRTDHVLKEEIICRYIDGRSKKGPVLDGIGEGCL